MAKAKQNGQEDTPKPRGKKQIKDAVLYDASVKSENIQEKISEENKRIFQSNNTLDIDEGLINMPPIELSDEENKRLATQSLEKELRAMEISNSTTKHDNGLNVWRLVSKTENKILQWTNVVTAMKIGTSRGVLVCVKESHSDKVSLSTTFIQNGILEEKDGLWILK